MNMCSSNKKSSSVDPILRSLTAQDIINYYKVHMATPRYFKLNAKRFVFESLTEIST